MDPQLQAWRKAGKHLPDCLKDFSAQGDVFRAMHEMIGPQDPQDLIRRPTCVEGHCYVIDYFLWFMARHGYTLQRSRAALAFDSLQDSISAVRARHNAMWAKILGKKAKDADAEPAKFVPTEDFIRCRDAFEFAGHQGDPEREAWYVSQRDPDGPGYIGGATHSAWLTWRQAWLAAQADAKAAQAAECKNSALEHWTPEAWFTPPGQI